MMAWVLWDKVYEFGTKKRKKKRKKLTKQKKLSVNK